jgi:hypothetical protein
MSEQLNTISDLATSKTIYIDGKKVGGVKRLNIEFGVDKESLQTTVTMTFAIKRNSLKISNVDTHGAQRVEFSTTNEAFA